MMTIINELGEDVVDGETRQDDVENTIIPFEINK